MRILDDKEEFIQSYYATESSLFLELREKAKQNKCDHMIVAASEARLLQSLVEIHNSKKIVEIGTLYGYSAIHFARGISGEGKVWTLEKDPRTAEIAQSFIDRSDLKNKIEIVVGDAHVNLKTLEKYGPFDCVFIDADKSGYPDYLAWAEKNVKSGGLIIADNTFLGGTVWGAESDGFSKTQTTHMHEFHKAFSDPKRFKSTIYPSYDGIAVGVKVYCSPG